jgi:hypothetical protein
MAFRIPAHLTLDTHDAIGARTARAFDRLRQCPVVIKRASGATPVEALQQEWLLAQQLLPGPYLTPVEFCRSGPSDAHLTSLWIDGEPFDRFAVTHAGPELYAVTQQALLGLARLHRAGYLHGDIRPENLLVASSYPGYQAHWLDLEHATRYGSLLAGFSYTESWRANAPEGGEALTPRSELRAFGELLGHSLKVTPDARSASVAALHGFAARLCDSFGRAQIGDAEEARYALAEMAAAAGAAIPDPPADAKPPVPVTNRRAEHQWRQLRNRWQQQGGRLAVRVRGPRGCGKTTFLRQALAAGATRGHAVLDLLTDSAGALPGKADPELLRDYVGDTALPPVLAVRIQDSHPLLTLVADVLPASALVLLETPGDSSPGADLPLPQGYALDDWHFPPLTAREWFQWAGASI